MENVLPLVSPPEITINNMDTIESININNINQIEFIHYNNIENPVLTNTSSSLASLHECTPQS